MALVWSYGITTVPERTEKVFLRTLESIRKSGFTQPRIFLDGADFPEAYDLQVTTGCPVSPRLPRLGLASNWIMSMVELYLHAPNADRYALFQDDLTAVKNLRAYLDAVDYPARSYLNLFTFLDNEALTHRAATKGFVEGAEMNSSKAQTFHGRRQQVGRGALALVFDREALTTLFMQPHLVKRPQDGERARIKVDGGIVEAMNKAGWREYVHNPSLVSHTGAQSTKPGVRWAKNARSFPGENFDALTLLK